MLYLLWQSSMGNLGDGEEHRCEIVPGVDALRMVALIIAGLRPH